MREISLHILDIAQNSIAAGASRIVIEVAANTESNTLTVRIGDNGRGMPPEFLAKVKDPWVTTRTTRKVGLGIPMLAAAAELTDGRLEIESEPSKGTSIEAVFGLNHIDRAPLGDMVSTIITLIVANPDVSLRYEQSVDDEQFVLDTDEVKAQLEDVSISNPAVVQWLREYMEEGLSGIGVIS